MIEKLKANKGKIGAGILATFLGANVLEFDPEFKKGVTEAKEIITKPITKAFEGKPTKEDFTASDYIGVSVYIDGKRHRLTLSIEQRDILMGVSDDLAYIKRENGAKQVDILLMLDCSKQFNHNDELYEKCIDMVFEDFENEVE